MPSKTQYFFSKFQKNNHKIFQEQKFFRKWYVKNGFFKLNFY